MISNYWVYIIIAPFLLIWNSGCIEQPLVSSCTGQNQLGNELPGYRQRVESYGMASQVSPAVEPVGELTFADVSALVLMYNPRLFEFSCDVRAAEARKIQAGLLPNPEVGVDLENIGGDRAGISESETTISLQQTLLTGGKRMKGIRFSELRRKLAGWKYELKRIEVLTDAACLFVSALGAQREVTLNEETARLASDVARTVSERVKAGAASPVELMRAEVALSSERNKLRRAQQAVVSARIKLSAMWGSAEPRFSGVSGDLEIELELPALADLKKRLLQNPELMHAAAEVVTGKAAIELEKSKAFPDVTVFAGYRRLEAEQENTIVAGISVPIPIFNRNQGKIGEAEADLARSEWRKRAVLLDVCSALADSHNALTSALEERRSFKDKILPGALSAFKASREGYEKGKFDYLYLLTAQQVLAQTRADYVRVLVRVHLARARVERLIGESLTVQKTGRKS